MFWKFNTTSSPHFEAVLQKENVTLQELMEEDDIIQECKSQNKKLVDFLCKRNVLEELVTLITEEPSEELDERSRFKYPNIACELLTCDVPALNESLSRDNELLEKLYSFIDKDPPLNPLLASFLSRTLGVLIVKRLDQHWISYQFTCLQAMGFLKDKENFISLLLKHLGTSAIMDLTLKLITEVGDVEHRQNLLNWLDSQNLVQSLIALFDPKVDSERHHNSAQLICDVLRISREALNDQRERLDTDPILARLESPDTIALMLDQMLGVEKSESSIVGGIQVLLALLGHKNSFNENNLAYNNAYDETEVERKQKIATSTALVILHRLKDFHQILIDPPKKPAVKTSINTLDPPFGNTRLQITKLLATLIALDNEDILRELMRLGTVELLLDLFFKYVWNNFLHAQVQQCLIAALSAHVKPTEGESGENTSTSDNLMYPYLIIKCRLLDRILEAWDDNDQKQTKPKGIRQGYMGHLINIANEIVHQCESNNSLDKYITEHTDKDTLEAWNNFVNSSLAETNKTQRVVLGGIHPSNLTSDDSNDDYNIPYPQASMLHQQIFNEFQMQQMTPEIIENYGFHDDEFSDPDDPLHQALERRTNINLNMNEGDLNRQVEMFRKVCSDYINTLDDADDYIFEEQSSGARKGESWDPRDSSSDDEDSNPPAENSMDVDPWSNLEGNKSTITLLEPKDPWSSLESGNSSAQQDGWADFGNFPVKVESANSSTSNSNSTPKPGFIPANPPDMQSSGDQQKESVQQDSTITSAVSQVNDEAMSTEKTVDNHPEPVPVPTAMEEGKLEIKTPVVTSVLPPVEAISEPAVALAAGDAGNNVEETSSTSAEAEPSSAPTDGV